MVPLLHYAGDAQVTVIVTLPPCTRVTKFLYSC